MNLTVESLLARLPAWWKVYVRWAIALVISGPRWIPGAVRRLPLSLACISLELYILWLCHG